MDSARPKNGDPAQAAWDEAYKKILDALNVKIRAYNEEVETYNSSIGAIEGKKIKNYTIIRTNTHTSEKKVTETRAASMTSGGSMTLKGDVVNEDSRMTAGKDMTIYGSLSNREEKNQKAEVTFGTTQESYTKKKHWPHKAHRRHYRSEIFMTPQKELGNETSLGVAGTADHTGNTPASRDITGAARDNVSDFRKKKRRRGILWEIREARCPSFPKVPSTSSTRKAPPRFWWKQTRPSPINTASFPLTTCTAR